SPACGCWRGRWRGRTASAIRPSCSSTPSARCCGRRCGWAWAGWWASRRWTPSATQAGSASRCCSPAASGGSTGGGGGPGAPARLRLAVLRRGKLRRPLLANRLQPLTHVLAHEGQQLERHGVVEDGPGHAEPVVQAALGPADSQLAALGELVRDLERF